MRRDRDMDMIRQLMLAIEEGQTTFEPISGETAEIIGVETAGEPLTEEEADKLERHLALIEEARFVEFHRYVSGEWIVDRITGTGHDFLDSVRDPKVWAATKEGVRKAGGFSIELVVALAKGFLKKKVEDATGIELDLGS